MTSLATAAKARYSTSAEEYETIVCFFDFQAMMESPKTIKRRVYEYMNEKPNQHMKKHEFK